MSYFHTGTRNIIGAEAFHCPVRDGKEWDHLAMVTGITVARCTPAAGPIRRVGRGLRQSDSGWRLFDAKNG